MEISKNGDIISIGPSLQKICRNERFIPLTFDEYFTVLRPGKIYNNFNDVEKIFNQLVLLHSKHITELKLRGQLLIIDNTIYYLGSIWTDNMTTIDNLGIEISDFSLTDSLTDFIQLINSKDIVEKELIEINSILKEQAELIEKNNHDLHIQSTLLNDLIDSTNMGTWQWNVQTGETIFNERWAEIIGYTLNEISPTNIDTWLKYAHPDDLQLSGDYLDKHFKGEKDFYDVELRMVHRNGNIIWVRDRGKVFSWDENGAPEWMYGTHEDITEKKNKQDELLVQKVFYEGIINAIPADIAVFDKDHKYLFVNPTAIKNEDLRKWIIGKDDLDYCKHYDKPISIANKRRDIFNKALKQGSATIEERLNTKDGVEYHLRHMFRVKNENEEVEYVIGYGINITEIKKAQIELEEAKRNAENEKNAKHLLLSTISHELRNPINAINSLISISSEENNVNNKELLDSLKLSAENIDSILKDILNEHRAIEQVNNLPSDFEKFILHIANTYKIQANRKNLEFNFNIQSTIPRILSFDKKLLSQILNNLLNNAVKYTNNGKITFSVKNLSIDSSSVLIGFIIEDTGIGIPENMRKKIFERYERVGGNSEFGIGLGLSIVKEKLNLLEGELNLESYEGKGSKFSVQMKFDYSEKDRANVDGRIKKDKKIKSILVVDDEVINFQVIQKLLKDDENIKLTYIDNGIDALEKLKKTSYDILLIDIKMPEISGFELLQRYILSDNFNKNTLFFSCSSDSTKSIKQFNFEGFDAFIEKPISTENLEDAINEYKCEIKYTDYTLLNAIANGDELFKVKIIQDLIKIINDFLKLRMQDSNMNLLATPILHKLKGVAGYAACEELKTLVSQDYDKLLRKENINYLSLASKLTILKDELLKDITHD